MVFCVGPQLGAIGDLSTAERAAVLHDNAVAIYGLGTEETLTHTQPPDLRLELGTSPWHK